MAQLSEPESVSIVDNILHRDERARPEWLKK
jgi:hypothetical protein